MQKTIHFFKLWLIVFSITCSVILFWQYRTSFSSSLASHFGLSVQEEKDNDVQMKSKDSIWLDMSTQFNLDDYSENPRVQREIHELLLDKKSLEVTLNHSTPYIYYIYSQVQKQHLPAELVLIPIIESEYNPHDHNSIGATGLWQFIPSTARDLKMKINGDFDSRLNLIDSTQGALTFFGDLNKEFKGNWYLTMAAYNCGPGCVASAVKREDSDNFFNLNLPTETKIYVPRLLAIATIIKNANKYGVDLPAIPDKPYFKEIKMPKAESLQDFAVSSGADLTELEKLNPNYPSQRTINSATTILVPDNEFSITSKPT